MNKKWKPSSYPNPFQFPDNIKASHLSQSTCAGVDTVAQPILPDCLTLLSAPTRTCTRVRGKPSKMKPFSPASLPEASRSCSNYNKGQGWQAVWGVDILSIPYHVIDSSK